MCVGVYGGLSVSVIYQTHTDNVTKRKANIAVCCEAGNLVECDIDVG